MKRETFYIKKNNKSKTITKISKKSNPMLLLAIDEATVKNEIKDRELILEKSHLSVLLKEADIKSNSILIYHLSLGLDIPILSVLSSEESIARSLNLIDYKIRGINKNILALEDKIEKELILDLKTGEWRKCETDSDFEVLSEIKKEKTKSKRKKTQLTKELIRAKESKNIPLFKEEKEFKLKYKI